MGFLIVRPLSTLLAQPIWRVLGILLGLATACATPPPVAVAQGEREDDPSAAPPLAAETQAIASEPSSAERIACSKRGSNGNGVLLELEVPGYLPSLLSLPLPVEQLADEPLLLGAHGAGDNAQSQCEVWREIIGPCGAILCPRGTPIGPGERNGYFFRNHLELEKEVLAAMRVLEAQFAGRIATQKAVYGAYSQGATMGALMLPAHGQTFTTLIMVEGGTGQWSKTSGLKFAQSGGERIVFVCGTPGCNRSAQRSTQALAGSGLAVRHLDVPGGGHAYWGAVALEIAKAWESITAGDERWR